MVGLIDCLFICCVRKIQCNAYIFRCIRLVDLQLIEEE